MQRELLILVEESLGEAHACHIQVVHGLLARYFWADDACHLPAVYLHHHVLVQTLQAEQVLTPGQKEELVTEKAPSTNTAFMLLRVKRASVGTPTRIIKLLELSGG